MADNCEEIGHGFRTIDAGDWYGRAAEAFHARFERQPKRYLAMADSYDQAADALDNYAAVLAWAQRQAGEVLALDDKEDPHPEPRHPVSRASTLGQQAELSGVLTGTDEPKPEPLSRDQRALAHSTYHRALALLDTVGNESATAIRNAAASLPAPLPVPPTIIPTSAADRSSVPSTSASDLVVHEVLRQPAPQTSPAPQTRYDPTALRDDPQDWGAAIRDVRRRLRWDGLNRLSPRLVQHIFEGHYKPRKRTISGYHHRDGGVDHGLLRVAQIIDGPDLHGVYRAKVYRPTARTDKAITKISTFFPDFWSPAEVLYGVRHAFLDAMRNNNYEPVTRCFHGIYKGVRIKGHLEEGPSEPRLCDIVTAYPRGVRKQRKSP
jgi:hypothetical protein